MTTTLDDLILDQQLDDGGPPPTGRPRTEAQEVQDAKRAEAREHTPGREHLTDLSEGSVPARSRPTQAQQRALATLTAEGDGFSTRRMSSPDHLLSVCKVCNSAIPFPRNPCEFEGTTYGPPQPRIRRVQRDGMPVAYVVFGQRPGHLPSAHRPILAEHVPTERKHLGADTRETYPCQCNGCQAEVRSKGNQPEFCSRACAKVQKQRQDRKRNEAVRAEERETARLWLELYPDASDAEVMEWAGIETRKRVTEARSLL